VLSFCTAVEVAVSRGAIVYPYRWRDASAIAFAAGRGAELAGPRGEGQWSLSPVSLRSLPAGAGLVLPSPNGATLCLAARERAMVIAGCLRNAPAVAGACRRSRRVALIAAGELDAAGTLRLAEEDLLGAGAIAARFDAAICSPQARAAAAAFLAARVSLQRTIASSPSGQELAEAGYAEDIAIATELDASSTVPRLAGDRFTT
jgi:2-phosphosulfolactate phosphatase